MSRRHRAQKREVLPDPKFGDLIVTKFMNYVMYEGKKAVAENILYGASGTPDPDDLIATLRITGLDAFAYARGLEGTVDPAAEPEIARAVVAARHAVREALAADNTMSGRLGYLTARASFPDAATKVWAWEELTAAPSEDSPACDWRTSAEPSG